MLGRLGLGLAGHAPDFVTPRERGSRGRSNSVGGDYSIREFLEGKSQHGRDLFRRFVAVVARCGPYEVAPAKTRVAFLAKVRFATVHHLRLRSPRDLDQELAAWLRQSYAEYGQRAWLAKSDR